MSDVQELFAECGFCLTSFVGWQFLAAGVSKARLPHEFIATVAAYQLLPGGAVNGVALLLIASELALGTLLMVVPVCWDVRAAAAVLLILFAGAVTINLLRGRREIVCGCAIGSGSASIDIGVPIRNTALALMLMLPWLKPQSEWFARVQGLLVGGALLLAAATVSMLREAPSIPHVERYPSA